MTLLLFEEDLMKRNTNVLFTRIYLRISKQVFGSPIHRLYHF